MNFNYLNDFLIKGSCLAGFWANSELGVEPAQNISLFLIIILMILTFITFACLLLTDKKTKRDFLVKRGSKALRIFSRVNSILVLLTLVYHGFIFFGVVYLFVWLFQLLVISIIKDEVKGAPHEA